MINAFVLIVIMRVNFGATVEMQQFSSFEACESARKDVLAVHRTREFVRQAKCVPQ